MFLMLMEVGGEGVGMLHSLVFHMLFSQVFSSIRIFQMKDNIVTEVIDPIVGSGAQG